MPVTIKVNGSSNSLVHKGSNGVSTATIPDVCKTPSPGGPIPIPYPNISQSATLAKGTKTVKADGGNMCANKGSEFSMSNGDEPGVTGGVKSSTFIKESTWILYSFDVKLEGKGACRLTDKKFQNHQNTVDLAGTIQEALGLTDLNDFKEYCKKCRGTAATEKEHATKMRETYKAAPGRTPREIEENLGETYVNKFGDLPQGDANIPRARTSFDEKPKVNPVPGECGELKTIALQAHEDQHWDDRNDLVGRVGEQKGRDVWNNGPKFHKDTETKAYDKERETYQKFEDECSAAGA
jgi:hypothetical protein